MIIVLISMVVGRLLQEHPSLPSKRDISVVLCGRIILLYVNLIYAIVFTNEFTMEIENYLVLLLFYLSAKCFFCFTNYSFLSF
jgi:hypothetical protein